MFCIANPGCELRPLIADCLCSLSLYSKNAQNIFLTLLLSDLARNYVFVLQIFVDFQIDLIKPILNTSISSQILKEQFLEW
jgi:hypothetical protein